MECRMRDSGPTPGKKPKNVGDTLALKARRLPCRTYWPPVNWLRIMKGPPLVALRIPTLGCSFQVLVKNDGRLMLDVQLTRDSNVSPYRTRPMLPVLSRGRS